VEWKTISRPAGVRTSSRRVFGAGRFGEPNGVDAVGGHLEGIVQVAHARSVRSASR
jgi:hypothetical protein